MPSRRVLQGLVLCAEDLEASKDSVHIAGYDPIAGDPSVGETPLYCDHPGTLIRVYDPSLGRLNFIKILPIHTQHPTKQISSQEATQRPSTMSFLWDKDVLLDLMIPTPFRPLEEV